jgi:hypothetical protein
MSHKDQLLFSVVSAEVEDVVDAVRSLAHCDTYGFSCNHSHKTFITVKVIDKKMQQKILTLFIFTT